MACYKVGGADLDHTGVLTGAALHALRASLLEIAMVGHVNGVRHVAGNVEQGVAVGIQGRLGLLQAHGIGVTGIVENLLHSTLLNDTACVHDYHIVSHFRNDTQVMGNEHNRAVDLGLQITQ